MSTWLREIYSRFSWSFLPFWDEEGKSASNHNLWQGNMTVKEYALDFTQLAKYAPTMATNYRARMSKFL